MPLSRSESFKNLANARVSLEFPEAKAGPDGWPYLFVKTSSEGTEPLPKIIEWLCEKGIGLVVNAHKGEPDEILTYGMVWGFKVYGHLEGGADLARQPSGKFQIEDGQKVIAGEPTEEFLPKYARKILKDFLVQQGVLRPKILLLGQSENQYDLCFSLDSLGNPPPEEHQGIAEALRWFLPSDYSLVLVNEEGLPPFLDI